MKGFISDLQLPISGTPELQSLRDTFRDIVLQVVRSHNALISGTTSYVSASFSDANSSLCARFSSGSSMAIQDVVVSIRNNFCTTTGQTGLARVNTRAAEINEPRVALAS